MPSRPNMYRPIPATVRSTVAQRGYGARWQRESKIFLRLHPICECDDCKASGDVVASEVVDHDPPHRGDMVKFWDVSTWRAMSKRCHDRKTARYDGGLGNPRKEIQ
jgi:5-methylcytosine-specific restriction protein A